MGDQRFAEVLRASVEEVLEKMFFVQGLDEPDAPSPAGGVLAELHFEGSPSGTLTLEVNGAAARTIAADFLAADENEITGQQVADVVCELANMICGSMLSKVESTSSFRLGAPKILSPEEASASQPRSGGLAAEAIHVSAGLVRVTILMDTHACPMAPEFAY